MKGKSQCKGILRPAALADLPLINRWLVQPGIRRWWGTPIGTQKEMRLGVMVPKESGQVFLIIRPGTGRPIGLVSLIHARAFDRSVLNWPVFLPQQAWEIGILIADRRDRRKGLGTRALQEVRKHMPIAANEPIFAWIKKDNKASLATFVKLGYVPACEKEAARHCSCSILLRYDPDAHCEKPDRQTER